MARRVAAAVTAVACLLVLTSCQFLDPILDPPDTRNALGMAITASLNAPLGDAGYGIFRF